MGYMVEDGIEVRLHTSKLSYVPRSYAHLSGLADFFSSKLDPTRPLKILNSACFTYKLRYPPIPYVLFLTLTHTSLWIITLKKLVRR